MYLLTYFNVNINAVYLLLFIGFLSLLLVCLLKPNTFENIGNFNKLSGTKKKSKKKVNSLKVNKNSEICENESIHESRHIEIKNSPEILDDAKNLHDFIYPLSLPGKPILRKSEEEILINKNECLESVWTKIPRDEVEILRSRHSSVVSLSQSEFKENEMRNETKLSRGQKKKLKAKLKTSDLKLKNEIKDKSQVKNLSSSNYLDQQLNDAGNSSLHSDNDNKLFNDQSNRPESLASTNSSQTSDKMRSFSSTENHEKVLGSNFDEDFLTDTFNNDENIDDYSSQPFPNDFNDSEEKASLEREIKDLKEERFNFLQKLNEFQSMSTKIGSLMKDNELLLKKNDDMERTYNAMKQELTSSIQKNSATEGQMARYKAEINQRSQYYENEMSKLTNKVNIIDNDNRVKAAEMDSLKKSLDQIHHLGIEKDKHIQNQNFDISSLNEQLTTKRKDCQDLESQIKHMNLKLNEVQNQKQFANDETQKLSVQMETLKREISKVQKEFEQFKRQARTQEKQQDAIIFSFQYQVDESSRERQQSMLLYSENEDKSTKSQISERQMSYDTRNSNSINASASTIISEENRRLQEKCNNFEKIINDYQIKEANLEIENSKLNDRYSKQNDEFEGHLREIVMLRKSIESLQAELSKNSKTTVEALKIELDSKVVTLQNSEGRFQMLQASIEDQEAQWKESSDNQRHEIRKLENELKSQASLVKNQNQKIIELTTLLQSYNNSENESMFNGGLS